MGLLLGRDRPCILDALLKDHRIGSIDRAADELNNLLITLDTEGPHHDKERDLGLDPRTGHTDMLWCHDILGILDNLHGHGLWCTLIVRPNRFNIDHFDLLITGLVVTKDEGDILGHALLTDNDSLAALDNEVATNILTTLTEFTGCLLRRIREEAEGTADHHRDLANVNVGQSPPLNLSLNNALLARCLHCVGRNNIGIYRCGIGHITKTGIIGIHWRDGPVILKDCRLANLNIRELDADLDLTGRSIRDCLDLVFGPLNRHADGGAGSTGCSSGRASEIQIWGPGYLDRAGPQNTLGNLGIHEVIEG